MHEPKACVCPVCTGGNGWKCSVYDFGNHEATPSKLRNRRRRCEPVWRSIPKFGLGIYDSLLKLNPSYVKYGYWLMNAMNTDELLIERFPETVYAIAKRLRELQPALLVSVHSGINGFMVAALKYAGLLGKIPFVIVCTDLTRGFLRSWVHPGGSDG